MLSTESRHQASAHSFSRFVSYVVVAVASLIVLPALAAFPDRPVRIVIPFPAGGAADAIGREMGNRLSAIWARSVIIDNRAGATGALGAQAVMAAAPDGYTLLMTASAPVVLLPAISERPTTDYAREFVPVTTVATWDLILVVAPSVPANDVKGLITYAKSASKPVSYGSAGNGAVNHVAGALFGKLNGLDLVHVPYKGDGGITTDLMGDIISMSFLSSQVALPQIKAGKLKALAVAGSKRMAALPNVPTMVESGVKDFEFNAWTGLFAPLGTPAPLVDEIQKAVARALNDEGIRSRLLATGSMVETGSPAQFRGQIERESAKWRAFARITGVKGE